MQEDNNSVLEKISDDLQKSLLKEYNKQILNKIPFLQTNFSAEVLEDLSLFVKEEYYFPNQIILKESLHQDISVMYIISGSVELIQTHKQDQKYTKSKKTLKENQIFGEINFFTGLANDICMKSNQFTKIIKIQRESFIKIIKEREKDFEIFCQIRDKMLMYQEFKDINLTCQICQLSTHLTRNCNEIHINKEQIFLKQTLLQSREQIRVTYERNNRSKFNSYKQIKGIQSSAKTAREFIKFHPIGTYYRLDLLNMNDDSSTSQEDNTEQSNVFFGMDNLQLEKIKVSDEQNSSKTQIRQEYNANNYQQSSSNFVDHLTKSQLKAIKSGENIQSFKDIDEQQISTDNLALHFKEQTDQQISSKSYMDQGKQRRRQTNDNNMKSSKSALDQHRTSIILDVANFREIYELLEQNQMYPKSPIKMKIPRKSFMKKASQNINDNDDILFEGKKNYQMDFKKQNSMAQYIKSETIMNSIKTNTFVFNGEEQDDLFNHWEFDQLKDYKYYFHQGNSKYIIAKQIRYIKKRNRTKKNKSTKQ